MKLLRKSLLLTVVFSGYVFLSMPSTTHGFIAMVGTFNILVKKVHKPQWRIGYNFTLGCAAAFELKGEDKLKAEVTKSLQVWLQPLRERYPNKTFTDDFIFVRMPDVKKCFDDPEQRETGRFTHHLRLQTRKNQCPCFRLCVSRCVYAERY